MATSPVRRRMIEGMTIRNFSPGKQRSYLHAVSRVRRHFGRSPDRLGLEEVHACHVDHGAPHLGPNSQISPPCRLKRARRRGSIRRKVFGTRFARKSLKTMPPRAGNPHRAIPSSFAQLTHSTILPLALM